MAESYFQHAEHYFRILNAMAQAAQQNQPPPQQRRPQGNYDQATDGDQMDGQDEQQQPPQANGPLPQPTIETDDDEQPQAAAQ
jgi:hypothetical protein